MSERVTLPIVNQLHSSRASPILHYRIQGNTYIPIQGVIIITRAYQYVSQQQQQQHAAVFLTATLPAERLWFLAFLIKKVLSSGVASFISYLGYLVLRRRRSIKGMHLSRDGKICCYGYALSTIFLLAFVPCFLLFVFRFSFLFFLFLFFPRIPVCLSYFVVSLCAAAICYPQQVRILKYVFFLLVCVICTLPHLGILLFFIRLFMLISILSCVSYASNFLWAFNFNFFLKFSAGRASTCLSSVYRVVLRTWLFPVYIPYSLATQDVQTVGTTKKRRNNFKCKKFWYQPKKKSAGLHFAFEVV